MKCVAWFKINSKLMWPCLVERAFSLFSLKEHCLDIELYESDIGLEFRTKLWHYSDVNAGACSVWNGVHCDISWRFLAVV